MLDKEEELRKEIKKLKEDVEFYKSWAILLAKLYSLQEGTIKIS